MTDTTQLPIFIFTETMWAKVMPTMHYKYTFEFWIRPDQKLALFQQKTFANNDNAGWKLQATILVPTDA